MGSDGKFFWYELLTDDVEAARRFYGEVVGWDSSPFDPDAGDRSYYVLNALDGRGMGGIMAIPDHMRASGARPGWLGYIHAADAEAKTAGIEAAGGRIHRPVEHVPDVGRMSVVADPQGAVFQLLEPEWTDQPPAAPMQPGHAGWNELCTSDVAGALDFYSGLFGWTKDEAMDMGEMGTYQLFSADGAQHGGIMRNPIPDAPPFWLFYFTVPELDAAMRRITENGGTVMMGPQEVPGGSWIAQASDPQGALFAITAAKR